MKRTFVAFPVLIAAVAGLAPLAISGVLQAQADPPAWAYAVVPTPMAPAAAAPAAAPELTLLRVPGSTKTFTLEQIEDGFGPADWFPEDHPSMPDVVAHGRRPEVRACASCHYPNGKGRPSNGSVTGLPVGYFIQAVEDFKNDLRRPADPRKTNVNQMIAFAKAMTPEELRVAAEYFGAMPWTPWIRVVEAERVPKTRVEGFIHYRLPGNDTEPLGMRIVEMPENTEQSEPLRNPRSGFVAYAPPGSLKERRGAGRDGRRRQDGAMRHLSRR